MSDFDLATLDAVDESNLAIRHPITNDPTTWVWTFYGPAHPKSVEISQRFTREALREEKEKEQARVNGKKWKGDERTPDEVFQRNVDTIAARVSGWTPVKMDGKELIYSVEQTKALLLDRKKGWLLTQVTDFLRDDASFMKPSEKT